MCGGVCQIKDSIFLISVIPLSGDVRFVVGHVTLVRNL